MEFKRTGGIIKHRYQRVSAVLLAGVMALAGCHRLPAPDPGPASAAEVRASLLRGAAWIWPDSNGPKSLGGDVATYREAAVLTESLLIRANRVELGRRTQPLTLPVGVRLIPVVHIESARDAPDRLTDSQRNALVDAVRRQVRAAAAGAGMIQIDFEAPARQRAAYQALLVAVREALPADIRLSVTALAHWCAQGDWLDRLPVDEVVPMLYRLGPQAGEWRRRFVYDGSRLARRCKGPAMGFATNDPPPARLLAQVARPYWFDEAAWLNASRPPIFLQNVK